MRDDALKLLTDIREALTEIDTFTAGIDLARYESDSLRRAAVERKFEIIGEACTGFHFVTSRRSKKSLMHLRSLDSVTDSSMVMTPLITRSFGMS